MDTCTILWLYLQIFIKTNMIFFTGSGLLLVVTSLELTISKFPKKWFKYSCMAAFARSEIDCWRPRAGRITGKTALEGTFLQPKFKYVYYYMHMDMWEANCFKCIKIVYKISLLKFHFSFSSTRNIVNKPPLYLFLTECSSCCEGTCTSSPSSSSCTTGICSPIPKFWSHSLTFN